MSLNKYYNIIINIMECSVCFEDTEHFSICNQCNECSIMCYICEKKWIDKNANN